MTQPIIRSRFSPELAVSDKASRQSLRDQGWQSVPYARWDLTPR